MIAKFGRTIFCFVLSVLGLTCLSKLFFFLISTNLSVDLTLSEKNPQYKHENSMISFNVSVRVAFGLVDVGSLLFYLRLNCTNMHFRRSSTCCFPPHSSQIFLRQIIHNPRRAVNLALPRVHTPRDLSLNDAPTTCGCVLPVAVWGSNRSNVDPIPSCCSRFFFIDQYRSGRNVLR